MSVLLRKEIRSLLPAWMMTIAATVLIAFVRPGGAPVLLFVVAIGSVLLGITSFGSEFSQGTFSLLLAQPTPRNRIWRLKTITLGAALLSVASMVLFVFYFKFLRSGDHVQEFVGMPLIFVLLFFGAAFAGGLHSALATRQMATAFWIALLIPLTLCGLAERFTAGRSGKIINISIAVALAVYDVLAFLLARIQFLQAQDLPGASGTEVSLPAWLRFGTKASSRATVRARRPMRALIAKELQLHQVSLGVAATLFILHVIAVIIRRMIVLPGNLQSELYESLAGWWLLWFILPVVIASSAVAEERRQGTLEGSLSLPAGKGTQWFIKCAVCFFLSILFAGVMPWLLETAAQRIGCPFPIKFHNNLSPLTDHWLFLGRTTTVAAIITLIAFYASSLARNLLQAIGVAVIVGSVFTWFVFQVAMIDSYLLHGDYMIGDILQFGLPPVFLLLLWLSYTNFKHVAVGWRLWRENLCVLSCVLVFVFGSFWGLATFLHPLYPLQFFYGGNPN
jgi:hypothetical protein